MTNEEIIELIRIVRETGIGELEIQRGDARVRITAARPEREVVMPAMMPVTMSPAATAVLPAAAAAPVLPEAVAAAPAHEQVHEVSAEAANDVEVKSPIVGTYYDSPSPNTPPFVRLGDRVEPKQVLCIIESMKLMNEIEAEVAGTLVSKFVDNGKPVEYGQALFTIRPFSA